MFVPIIMGEYIKYWRIIEINMGAFHALILLSHILRNLCSYLST